MFIGCFGIIVYSPQPVSTDHVIF